MNSDPSSSKALVSRVIKTFVLSIFKWPFKTGFTVVLTLS